jgi:hypothetical protein
MMIYRALMRSVIDYGAIAYDSAADIHLDKLTALVCFFLTWRSKVSGTLTGYHIRRLDVGLCGVCHAQTAIHQMQDIVTEGVGNEQD